MLVLYHLGRTNELHVVLRLKILQNTDISSYASNSAETEPPVKFWIRAFPSIGPHFSTTYLGPSASLAPISGCVSEVTNRSIASDLSFTKASPEKMLCVAATCTAFAPASMSVSGEESEGIFFGGLAGGLQFVYVDSNYATGDVTAAFANGVGGLLGFGVVYTGQSYATGAVVGYEDVGGFAGSLECSGAPVAESFSTGSVYGETSVGGFAGYVGAECGLMDNYTTSDVTAVGEGAGFVSELADTRISSSYAAGSVSSGGEYGGFVAVYSEEDSMIESSFWDAEVNTNLDNSPAVGLPTEDMKTLSSYTDAEWNFEDIWAISPEYNSGYPCLQWTGLACGITLDEDNDGSADYVEIAGPNDGDANDDSTADSEQANVLTYINPLTNEYAVLEAVNCTSISAFQVGSEATDHADAGFDYPMGLVSFHIVCPNNGDTATIRQYFYGVEGNENYSVRKWMNDGSYQEIPGYNLFGMPVEDQIVFLVEYQITDGSEFDDDGVADGVIVDPSGAALAATTTDNASNGANSSDPLSNTGQTIVLIYGIALTLIAGLIGFKLATRQQKPAKK